MKGLKETYVIVRLYGGEEDYFQDHVSFDKAKLEIKCIELNKNQNDEWEKQHIEQKCKHQFTPSLVFMVLTMKGAIEQFRSDVADSYTEHDESY